MYNIRDPTTTPPFLISPTPRPGWKPSTDERTGTRGCGEVPEYFPATKGD
jgi:hypothetical protein